MVILQIIDSLYRGGAQKVVLDIVRALPQHRHIVCYWTTETDLEEEFLQHGTTLVKIPFTGIKSSLITYFFLLRIISRHKPAIIHTHMFFPNILARLLPKTFSLIHTYHGEVFKQSGAKNRISIFIEKWTLFRCDVIIAVSKYVENHIRANLKTDRSINVVHNYGKNSSGRKFDHFGLPIRLVATSNNQAYKDYPLLIKAMSRLSEKPIHLDIFGNGMKSLIELAKTLGASNVNFRGPVPDVTPFLADYSAYIITSHSGEGFSLALLEAMNAGLPIICSNIPQFIEAVEEEAIIFEKRNLEDLVQKLLSIINQPDQLVTKAEGSRSRAILFSKQNFVHNISHVYRSINVRN